MIILKSWLEDYIDIPWSDEELVDKLTDAGSLVDSFYSTLDQNIVIAEILEIKAHPNADKLRLAKVWDGEVERWVVCGAPNIQAGQKVPLARVGAKIGDIIIAEAEIRGEKSHGMLCSEFELGLGNNHEGILILPEDSKLGEPLSSTYPSDLVMDLEITPNRGDCLSHLGIAREVSSILSKSLSKEPVSINMSGDNASAAISVKVEDSDLCPQYYVRVINNVEIGPSPDWLVTRLGYCGLKSINNVVDITNYVMLDLGQPLHAFDASKVANDRIIVRKSKKNEDIVTLDGEVRALESGAILIADSEKPLAIAGIMGGESSAISDSTKCVILEAAEFDRVSIRKTAKNLGLTTDASYRFERGIDPAGIEYALNKASKMIEELANGKVMPGIVKHSAETRLNSIPLECDNINKLLGTNLSCDDIKKILKYRGFKVDGKQVVAPTFRHDLSIWQDLAEEVMCIYGLSNIKQVPMPKATPPKRSAYYYKEYLKDLLVKDGFAETFSYSFMSDNDIKTAGLNPDDLLTVANPISPENKYLRNSLIPGILASVAKNPTFDPIQLFEIGNVFTKTQEKTMLCIATSGTNSEKIITKAVNSVATAMELKQSEGPIMSLSRDELKIYKIKKPIVFYTEIDLTNIEKRIKLDNSEIKLKLPNQLIVYRPVSKYPSLTRDVAFIVNKDLKPTDVVQAIYGASDLIINVELFDEFASDKFGMGKKNIAFHINLQASDRTMNDDEANAIIKSMTSTIEKTFLAKFRDK